MIMDYIKSKDPQLASRIETGDMKQEDQPITFEDIKPYVSMYKGDDGKMVYDVLDKDSKSVFKTGDAKDAMAYLKKNFDKLRKGGDDDHSDDEKAQHAYKLARDQGETEENKPEMPNASEEDVQEFIKSFFDYTSNQFPKGETAILTAVEKKFGDAHIRTAQEAIHKMTAGKDHEIEKIKKLAGVQ